MKVTVSPAALGLLRALIKRTKVPRDRILLTDWQSTDWQSLTFAGERHELKLRISGMDSMDAANRLVDELEDAELSVPGHIVADIAVTQPPEWANDDSTVISIEALTIVD